jgi:hypothetical protein
MSIGTGVPAVIQVPEHRSGHSGTSALLGNPQILQVYFLNKHATKFSTVNQQYKCTDSKHTDSSKGVDVHMTAIYTMHIR